VLPGNHQVLAMIASHWASAHTRLDADCVTIQVRLPSSRREPVTGPRAGRRPVAQARRAPSPQRQMAAGVPGA
jgi:hypothetical protein